MRRDGRPPPGWEPGPGWESVRARWRETETHHVDLDTGYTHRQWPADFTALLLPRVLPTLQARLADPVTVRVKAADHDLAATATAAGAADDPVIICGPTSSILSWLLGRPAALDTASPAPVGLTPPTSRCARQLSPGHHAAAPQQSPQARTYPPR